MSRRRGGDNNGFDAWGGYMAAKKAKLKEQFRMDQMATDDSNSGLFKGVAIYVNGYTVPTADELKRIMMVNGGTYHHYMDARTTHIIASNLPDTKVKALKGNEVIVRPQWIVECLKQQKIVDYAPFLLYTRQTSAQTKIRDFASKILPAKKEDKEEDAIEDKSIKRGEDHLCESSRNAEETEEMCDFLHDLNDESKESDVSSTTDRKQKRNVEPSTSRVMDAKDSRFLSSYYGNSRLHHISAMGAQMKRYVIELRANNEAMVFPKRSELSAMPKVKRSDYDAKIVLHIDMDCFFVSVGLLSRPDLISKPVAVAHARNAPNMKTATATSERYRKELEVFANRKSNKTTKQLSAAEISAVAEEFTSMSELASVSYEARRYGVKNGMFLGPALKLCPDLTTIPYDFEAYKTISKKLYDIVGEYTLEIMAISCDELVVDVTDLLGINKDMIVDPVAFVKHLRQRINSETKCNASIGLGPTLLLARMALRKAKPNNYFYLGQKQAETFMQDVSVRDLPGVGRNMQKRLEAEGIETCGQLQGERESRLVSLFGAKTGKWLFDSCRGVDHRQLETTSIRKSVSAEVNYGIRFDSEQDSDDFLNRLAQEVEERLVNIDAMGKTITLKVMVRSKSAPRETSKFLGHGICDSFSKSKSLSFFTSKADVIARESKALMKLLQVDYCELRGIGIQMTRLEHNNQNFPSSKSSIGINGKQQGSILAFLRKDENDKDQSSKIVQASPNKFTNVKEQQESVTASAKKENCKKDNTKNFSIDYSFSQLDTSVLDALPRSIRDEVLATCKSHKVVPDNYEEGNFISSSQDTSTVSTVFSKNIGKTIEKPSLINKAQINSENAKYKNDGVREETGEDCNNERESSNKSLKLNSLGDPSSMASFYSDYSFSQIDSSVLNALPKGIQEEVIVSCRRQKEEASSSLKKGGLRSSTDRGSPDSRRRASEVSNGNAKKGNTMQKIADTKRENKHTEKDANNCSDEKKDQASLEQVPSSSRDSNRNYRSIRDETKEEPAPSSNSADYSFSQLDTSVLNSLPKSIREEVLATCSHGKASSNKIELDKEVELSSFSQIDPEVFEQLPEEMRKEIQLDVEFRQGRQRRSETLQGCQGEFKAPNVGQRSAVVKSRRGRPPKHLSGANLSTKKSNVVKQAITNMSAEVSHSKAKNESNVEQKSPVIYKKVSLNGATSSEDVCDVLHTWISSYALPTNDDIQMVIDYVAQLVVDDLDQTLTVLRFLQRNLLEKPVKSDESERSRWEEAFLSVARRAQSLVKEIHGCRLSGVVDL